MALHALNPIIKCLHSLEETSFFRTPHDFFLKKEVNDVHETFVLHFSVIFKTDNCNKQNFHFLFRWFS